MGTEDYVVVRIHESLSLGALLMTSITSVCVVNLPSCFQTQADVAFEAIE